MFKKFTDQATKLADKHVFEKPAATATTTPAPAPYNPNMQAPPQQYAAPVHDANTQSPPPQQPAAPVHDATHDTTTDPAQHTQSPPPVDQHASPPPAQQQFSPPPAQQQYSPPPAQYQYPPPPPQHQYPSQPAPYAYPSQQYPQHQFAGAAPYGAHPPQPYGAPGPYQHQYTSAPYGQAPAHGQVGVTGPPSSTPAPATGVQDQAHTAHDDPGEIIETMGNGTVKRKHADGHKSTTYPDGRIEHNYIDGSTKTIYPNGQTTFYTPTVAKEDYLDKAISKGAKSLGFNLSREKVEKIGDKARTTFEKKTGKKVSAKFSN